MCSACMTALIAIEAAFLPSKMILSMMGQSVAGREDPLQVKLNGWQTESVETGAKIYADTKNHIGCLSRLSESCQTRNSAAN